jgi:trigger factor
MELSVQIEKTSPIVRKLTIKVPAQKVNNLLERGYKAAQRTAKIKGFRPGMVPLPLVKQYYGTDIRHQAYHEVIEESVNEAIRKEQLRAVGSPKIETPEENKTGHGEHDHEIRENEDFTFVATVEILPELEVKGYTGLTLTQDKVDVTDAEVAEAVKGLVESQAQLEPVSGRAVIQGDFVDLEFDGGLHTDQGVEKKAGMKGSRLLEIGSGALIPGFEEQVIGMKQGETKTFDIAFPADYHEASFANQKAQFTVTANEIKAKKLPTVDDELAKTLGYESVSDMNFKAREHLTTQKSQDADRKLRSDLLAQIIEKNPFDVPASLIQAQTRALAQDVGNNLRNQGFNDQMIQEAVMSELDNLKKRAESQVRASLLLEAIAKKEEIAVKTADIDAEIAKMATNMKVDVERIREFYEKNPQRRDDLEFRLREDQTLTFLIGKAKLKKA